MRLLIQRGTHTHVVRVAGRSAHRGGTWHQLADLIDQLFPIERLVVFELPLGSQHLVPVETIHCEMKDLGERRRDHRRSPFVDALEAGGPIRVDHAHFRFFQTNRPGDTQLLAPLRFEETLLGFVAADISADALASCPDFAQTLHRVTEEAAAVLAYQRAAQCAQVGCRVLGFLAQVPEQPLVTELEQTRRSVAHRLGNLEQVFESSVVASAVYDLFGKRVLVNGRMRRLLGAQSIDAGASRACDLLARLTGRSVHACRHVMRQVILDRREQVIPAVTVEGRRWSLHVRPLLGDGTTSGAGGDAPQPFRVQGIHFELAPETSSSRAHASGRDEIPDIVRQVGTRLDELAEATAKLTDAPSPPENTKSENASTPVPS